MKKDSVSLSHLGTFPSPGASDYHDNGVVVTSKGWSSERVPHPGNSNGSSRRHISASSLTPFYSGRTLPSKWEDAERWICSPVLGYSVSKNVNYQLQRRPKSKSGPIMPPGIAFYSNCSPSMHLLDGGGSGSVRNLMAGSPFSTGVLMADGVAVHYGGRRDADACGNGDAEQSCMVQNDSNVHDRQLYLDGQIWLVSLHCPALKEKTMYDKRTSSKAGVLCTRDCPLMKFLNMHEGICELFLHRQTYPEG
ncbi:hypothetical protein CRYUN_Cryun22dG0097700 [Craigia yunnanensis]